MDLSHLRGVWFPISVCVNGRWSEPKSPTLPAPQDVMLLTIIGEEFFVTSNGDYYWTRGRLQISDEANARHLEFLYPGLADTEFAKQTVAFEISRDELILVNHAPNQSDRYIRVATDAPPEILALIAAVSDRTRSCT